MYTRSTDILCYSTWGNHGEHSLDKWIIPYRTKASHEKYMGQAWGEDRDHRAEMKYMRCCYTRFTSPLYHLPYPGIELPTSPQYWSLLITTLLILSNAPGLDSRTASWLSASWLSASWLSASWLSASWLSASWLSASCLPHGKPFTMHIAQPHI